MKTDLSDKLTTPRMSTPTLELRNRYFAVTDGNVFSYYPITWDLDDDRPILRFTKTPPVLLEGYAIVNKKIYLVSSDDILRRVIRKSKEVTLESINGTATEPSTEPNFDSIESRLFTDPTTATLVNAVIQSGDIERTVIGPVKVEVGTAADLAWSEQVRALLHTSVEEEEFELGETWEIENTAQS
jgi:hypothetical protein